MCKVEKCFDVDETFIEGILLAAGVLYFWIASVFSITIKQLYVSRHVCQRVPSRILK